MSRTRFSSCLASTLTASAFLSAFLLISSVAQAVQPSLSAIQPYGFQRGTEVDVQFTGARLSDAQELLFYSPGVTVKSLTAPKANVVQVKLAIDPNCRIGIHAVRVRTATGLSNLRTFSIGVLPEAVEVEPNSEFEKPQAITLGVTINGIVQNEDVDHFVIEAKKGQRIVAEVEGVRLGNTFFDPYLAILNEERFELQRSDDAALLRQDCLCSIIAPKDGKYIIQIRESAYGGNGACKYRLHIGSFPRPTAVMPAGGKPGETLEVRWIGDPAGEFTSKITLPTDGSDKADLIAQDDKGLSVSPNVVRVIDLPNVLETEPNDDRTKATAAPAAPLALNGILEKPGDIDHFKFAAKKGQSFDVRVHARKTLRSPLDSVITILRSNGAGVTSNDDSGGPDSYVRFNVPADDEYTISIRDHLNAGGINYAYRVEITLVKPMLTMGLPERQRYIPTILNVPRGNRMALMITASRANFGGELNVNLEGMPQGMTIQTITMASNRSDIPVVFSAAADAPVAGALADLVGKPVDEKIKVVGHLNQRTMLVRGQNNRDVWGHNTDRMAVAITDEVPFKIDIVQPKVPIVRNGSMSLKVVATRKEGFTAAIGIRLLYNPPGIGSSGSISIPAGKNEALIPMTANSGAQIRTWPLIVIARAAHAGGTVETSSQMADLIISDGYFSYAFDKAAAEQGQETELVIKMTKKKDFAGTAKVELLGLPAKTSSTPIEINKDTTELVFKIKVEKDARPGRYKSLLSRTIFTENGEPVTHTLGTGELRVDKPLPPKVAVVAKPVPKAAPKPVAKAKPPVKKRLSRLEQLRLDRENAKAAAGG